MASKGQISGMRGVFLVAAELAQRGFVVSPTSRSARGVDLLATNLDGTRTFAVEVKSSSKSSFWLVSQHAGQRASRNNIWVFVFLGTNKARSSFYVVPSTRLAALVEGTRFWHVKRARVKRYEDRWSLFEKATAET